MIYSLGNVQIEGKDYFSPMHVWTSRYSNHLASSVLQTVIIDLKRHLVANFSRETTSVACYALMKYVVDSDERNRFLNRSSPVAEISVSGKVDAFTQTERLPLKRNFREDTNFASKLEAARNVAKRKREEKLKKAFSVLNSGEIEKDLSKCNIE